MKPYARILASIDQEFTKALADFRSDEIFQSHKMVYTDAEKKRIGYRWMNLVRPFRQLKSIIRSLMWRSFFIFGSKDVFVVKYAAVVTYYNMLYDLRSVFGSHEEFIRQYLDDHFHENYSTLARFIYHIRFFTILSFPREYFLSLKDQVHTELHSLFERKEKASQDIEKRFTLDMVNIGYYLRYRIHILITWISKKIGMTISSIYFSYRDHGLIADANIEILIKNMMPGDICITRRNWAATNMSIPGFWKHMSMYIGTGRYLKKNFPEFLSTVSQLDDAVHYIIEVVGEGVQIVPIHTLANHNDYLGILRTVFSERKINRAISRTLQEIDARYDFSFNFYSDVNFVCSTLITKAYLPEYDGDEGMHIILTRIMTGITYPPHDIVKKFSIEQNQSIRELGFVGFSDLSEKKKISFLSDEAGFLNTLNRPRLSIFLP